MATQNESEVEADRKAAEDSGCAVTLRSNNAGYSNKDKSNERPVEEETKGRGRGQAWGRRRPRGPRTRPHGHFAQGSQRDNSAAESLHNNDSDRFVATGFDQSADQVSSPCDFDTSQPQEGSHLLPHNSSQSQYSGQDSGEGHRGQRSAGGRGHSRPKYVTVPDASHSHDVRHVEQVNNSIVINIDRSAKPAPEPVRRGRGGRGGGERGTGARSDYSAGTPDDDAGPQSVDRDFGAPPNRSGYRGQGGRRPFRGQGDGSYRGQGRGDGGYRRARGDGPRPFRGGYRGDYRWDIARGGRGARRAVIHVSAASSGGAVGSACAQDEEDWDRDVSASAGDSGTGDGENAWLGGEDNGAGAVQEERQIPDETEDGSAGHFLDGSLASGVKDHEDGVDVSHARESQVSELDAGKKTERVLEKKEVEQNIETAGSKQQPVTGVKGCDSDTNSKALAVGLEGVKSEESVQGKQNLAKSAEADVKVDTIKDALCRQPATGVKGCDSETSSKALGLEGVKSEESIQEKQNLAKSAEADVKVDTVKDASCSKGSSSDQVVGKASKDALDETAEASKKTEPDKSRDQITNSTELNPSTVSDSDKLKTAAPPASAEISNSSVPSTASEKDSPVLSSDVVSEIPTASVDKET